VHGSAESTLLPRSRTITHKHYVQVQVPILSDEGW